MLFNYTFLDERVLFYYLGQHLRLLGWKEGMSFTIVTTKRLNRFEWHLSSICLGTNLGRVIQWSKSLEPFKNGSFLRMLNRKIYLEQLNFEIKKKRKGMQSKSLYWISHGWKYPRSNPCNSNLGMVPNIRVSPTFSLILFF